MKTNDEAIIWHSIYIIILKHIVFIFEDYGRCYLKTLILPGFLMQLFCKWFLLINQNSG